jgi:hypothetical protein
MSDRFAHTFRATLVDHVARHGRPRRHRRTLLGTGAALAVVLGGTVAAAASGLLTLPGGTETTHLGATRTGTFTGTDDLELGERPADATGVAVSFTCLAPGQFTFDDGAAVTCTTTDDSTHPTTYLLPLNSIQDDAVSVTTSPDAAWTMTAGYVSETTTQWAVNESGQSYGVINEHGVPDLIAVIATNGRQGYVNREDLEDANGTTAAKDFRTPEDALRWQEENEGAVHLIPVYEADGTTPVGEFRVGGP